ncbi:SRPBCC family protein [Pseudomonas petrae]|uniref:SRPBCC family protein n=1 Tax=Pseudomonas petrae TaxID=2912190 RepID=A0ABS9I5V7_9PSED|nr:SRPBCC family protein [Pseudomonas petrae]MCF7532997.1 SRPBCC family protein [Pseudomonas petrae]MCF7535647.1 SRPBCC family protein [Pseudomonas petrae]MCF7543173.1 SRPBCC family protein [Pseudomonas petrae]MCF7554709.1 SRPBCC family protein [Pseudomonas petrae]
MVLVEYSAGLPCSAEQAWKVLRAFGGIADWHPAIVKSGIEGEAGILGVGAVRRLALGDGAVLRERLTEFDDGLRALAYVFEESPLPVDGYRAKVRVDEVAGLVERCEVRWSARFEVREVGTEGEFEESVRGLIVQGHEGLEGVVRG